MAGEAMLGGGHEDLVSTNVARGKILRGPGGTFEDSDSAGMGNTFGAAMDWASSTSTQLTKCDVAV